MANHVGTRNDGQCLKRITLRDEYTKKKKKIKYVKSSKPCKLARINELRAEIRAEFEQEEINKALAEDPDLVILDSTFNSNLGLVRLNEDYIKANL